MKKTKNNESNKKDGSERKLSSAKLGSETVVSESTLDDFTGVSNFYLEDGDFGECSEEDCEDWNMLHDTYSMAFKINLPPSIKYAIRSGTVHMNMERFCERSRGCQGPAIGVAAIVTSHLEEAPRWDEFTVDQVVKDGDKYYNDSFKELGMEDPGLVTVDQLKRRIDIRNKYRGYLDIGEPQYIGQFRSEDSRILHVAKVLELFFSTYDAGVLTSKVLNIGIWRSSGYYNIFDGQARLDCCEIAKSSEDKGSAKLIILQNLMAVVFVILEKSNVRNEMFIMHPVSVMRVSKFCEIDKDLEELEFGGKTKQPFQSIVRCSYHLHHPLLPVEFHGRGQLPLAMTAIIYSKFVPSANWSSLLVDLIFNQSSVYLTELARALEKPLDSDFELSVTELPEDVVIGVYRSKVKIEENVVPGDRKEKLSIQDGVREFYSQNSVGIIEIDNMFYAMWRDNKKYYLFNPLACDKNGQQVDAGDPESKHATACVTMNSSPLELLDLLLGDTEEESEENYAIHRIDVIYVKSGLMKDGSDEEVLYQKCKKDKPETSGEECVKKVDSLPRPKEVEEFFVDEIAQYPELMDEVEKFVGSFDEIEKGDAKANEEDEKLSRCIDFDVSDIRKCRLLYNSRYKIANPHRLRLKATKNCVSKEFMDRNRGRQGLVVAVGAMAQSQKSEIEKWTSSDLDKIIESANAIYEKLVGWILAGSEGDFEMGDDTEENLEGKAEDATSQMSKKDSKGLEQMNLSMLPTSMKIKDTTVNLVSKMNVLEGDANPMANLGEALEKYFQHFDEMILENKRLFYGVWKSGDKYFMLNPYGSDKDGWRNQAYPAQLCVTDCLNELVNLLYGVLEFNEYHFVLHFVKVAVSVENEEEEQEQEEAPELELPEIEIFERFKTHFLPVTDEDFIEVTAEKKEDETPSEDLAEEQDDAQDKMSVKTGVSKVTWKDEENKLTNLFEESAEPEPLVTPTRLNFSLVTGIIKVQMAEEEEKDEQKIEMYYEHLKYKHTPPFVLPTKHKICNVLDAKNETQSVSSLVSKFSIDSKLIIKIDSESPEDAATISLLGLHERSKLITIPRQKYFLSISLPSGYTPIRAINEKFIRDKTEEEKEEEECKKKKLQGEKIEKVVVPQEKTVLPKIIPLGPCISTPKPKPVYKDCPDKEGDCPLTKCEREDEILKKLVCSTENLLFEMMIPDFQDPKDALKDKQKPCCPSDEEDADDDCGCTLPTCKEPQIPPKKSPKSPCNECGFVRTSSDNIGVIQGQCCLEPRACTEPCHYKPCFYASMLCVLAKVCVDAHEWTPQVIDRLVAAARKISTGTGRLRYKQSRRFRNVDILGAKCDVTLRQVQYADPERYEQDCLGAVLDCFLKSDRTGIVVFANAAYAFWMTGEVYYLFDGYGCDADGRGMEGGGGACLMEICDFETLVQRIEENTGEPFGKAYRLYTLKISHLEKKRKKRSKKKKKGFYCLDQERDCDRVEEPISDCYEECAPDEASDEEELIEQIEWVTKESTEFPCIKMRVPGFAPVKNFNASAIEVEVLRNKITRPINAPFQFDKVKQKLKGRKVLYDRKFYPGSALDGALDLVVMAWSRIHEPTRWSVRTIQGLFSSSLELCYDSVLASEDTSVPHMVDDLLDEFTVANYQFRAILGPRHAGNLYAKAGWNLAMALEKLFEAKVYSGAIIVCGEKHVGVMKKDDKFYAWWPLLKSKKLRIIASRCIRDYLKLIVKELGQPEPVEFIMRIVTISYAKILAPHCSDIDGLHESLLPSSEIAEVLVPESKDYDLESLYRPTDKCQSPLYIRGVAAICDRDAVTEPLVKRCYFVALIALVLRRDIIQNPLPAMVDKVLEIAEATYKLIEKPKYHTQHVVKDLPLLNRVFDVRDRASELTLLLDDDGYVSKKLLPDELSKKLRRFFDRHTAALLHLSNCSYGIWYSSSTDCYYLLDPYACDCKGRRTCARGKGCLSVFPTLCGLIKHISDNRYELTTGFYLHEVHVEAVNEPCLKKDELMKEDPIWLYLDCHWSFWHELKAKSGNDKDKKSTPSTSDPPRYKNYLIEIPGKVYSLWGTVGAFDSDFGLRAGKAQAAICIAAIAMRNLSQPSDWCPSILDTAVILGDHYYRDSNKDESNRCLNRFNLIECLRASPHKWRVKFSSEICGVLYSRGEQPNLARCIEKGLARAKNLVVQCQRRFLTVLKTSDALYVVDPSWIGPPLFAKGHGAIYALRCNDERTLVYVLTKMLNTNESLELSITPIELSFCQENCNPTDSKYRNRILTKTYHDLPGRVSASSHRQPLVCGDIVAPSEDSFLSYSYKLKLGLASDLEKPAKFKSTKPTLPTKRFSLADKERKLRVEVNKIRRRQTLQPRVVDVADRKTTGVYEAKGKRAVVMPPRRSFTKCELKELYGKYNASLKKPVYMGLLHPGDRDPDDERWPRPGPPGSNLFDKRKKHE